MLITDQSASGNPELIGEAPSAPRLNLGEEPARLAAAQASRQELALQREREELLPVSAVASAWRKKVQAARAILLVLPTKLAPKVVGTASPLLAEADLRAEIHQALEVMAAAPRYDV